MLCLHALLQAPLLQFNGYKPAEALSLTHCRKHGLTVASLPNSKDLSAKDPLTHTWTPHLLAALSPAPQALCEELPSCDDALLVWEAASRSTALTAAQLAAGPGAPALADLRDALTR